MHTVKTCLLFLSLQIIFCLIWYLFISNKLIKRYLHSVIYTLIMIISFIIILTKIILTSDTKIIYQTLFVNHESIPLFEGIHLIIYLSILYHLFDFIVEYIFIAKTWQNIFNCHRLQLLMIYTWTLTLNLFIVYYRNRYINITILLLILWQLTNITLNIGDFLTQYKQSTIYLVYSCWISFILSISTRIIIPALLVIYCLYNQWIYWIINDTKIKYKNNDLPDLLDLIHIISFFGIWTCNIWWTFNLYQKSQLIPITTSKPKSDKKLN